MKFEKGAFNKEKANEIIDNLVQQYNITIDKKRFVSAVGRANISKRHIRIPKPISPEKFLVSLHEIGHIVVGHGSKLYITEYKAEMFAIEYAIKCELDKRYIQQYENTAKGYVLMCIAKGYCRGLNLDKLNPKIISWLGYNEFNKWKNNKVFIHNWKGNSLNINFTGKEGIKEEIISF